jgi:serine/threonine protein kinase
MLSLGKQVDVWSAGILFYQMLFGRRPFGHDQTQERILREDTIIKARKVDFPSRPAVSNEAKVSYAHWCSLSSNNLSAGGRKETSYLLKHLRTELI